MCLERPDDDDEAEVALAKSFFEDRVGSPVDKFRIQWIQSPRG
jgi:hypothetical protein